MAATSNKPGIKFSARTLNIVYLQDRFAVWSTESHIIQLCYDVVFPRQIYSNSEEDGSGQGLVVRKHSELPALEEVPEVPDGKVHSQQLSVEHRVVQLTRIKLNGKKAKGWSLPCSIGC